MINKQSYQIQGMRQDNLVSSGYSSKFAHEIMNMRFNTIGDYTTVSWTTEKGTKEEEIYKKPFGNSASKTYEWITTKAYYNYSGGTETIAGYYKVSDFKPIGQAIINDQWVLFGIVYNQDSLNSNAPRPKSYSVIICLEYMYDTNNEEHLYGRVLYWGKLGFDEKYPIETIVFYENEKLQKVYWTDGKNQPRVINIKGVEDLQKGYNDDNTEDHDYIDISTIFDFTQTVSLNETVEIIKDQSGAGLFPPGTVKYALSYYHKCGQETNIVYDSPLYYPTLGERACSPDELSGDSFYVKVSNLDLTHGFDYIRLYSIVKTTDNATPIVRIVEDKSLKGLTDSDSVIFHDTNTTGQIIDPSIIQFIGGKEIIAHTFDQKNNTLFLGNIELKTKSVTKVLTDAEVINSVIANAHEDEDNFHFDINVRETLGIRKVSNDWSVYQWVNQLNQTEVWRCGDTAPSRFIPRSANSQYTKHFKFRETYRFGIQFQDNKGAWSEVLYLNDLTNNITPSTDEWNTECLFAGAKYTLPAQAVNVLKSNGYKKARLVCCYPTNADRKIIAQGVVAPTVYNNEWRESHTPDVMSSWFFRPNDRDISNQNNFDVKVLPWKDNQALDKAYYVSRETNSEEYYSYIFKTVPEIQSTFHRDIPNNDDYINTIGLYYDWTKDKSVYKVCRKILTFHSPEIEFDESLRTMPSDNWDVVVIGKVPINSFAAKLYLEADTPARVYGGKRGNGLSKESYTKTVDWYHDNMTDDTLDGTHMTALGEWNDANLYTSNNKMREFIPYVLYPFQRKSSLNNYIKDIEDWECNDEYPIKQSATLHSKCISHILYSTTGLFANSEYKLLNKTDNTDTVGIDNATFDIFDSDEVLPLKLKTDTIDSTIYTGNDFIYYGNINNISPISDNLGNSHLKGYNNKNNVFISGSYPIAYYKTRTNGTIKYGFKGVEYDDSNLSSKLGGIYTSDPVPITYKSSPHGVFFSKRMSSLDANEKTYFINVTRKKPNGGGAPGSSFKPDSVNSVTEPLTKMPFLYLAEIRRKVDETTRFGGKPTLDNPIDNIYVPCGPAVNLVRNNPVELKGLEGDTYYMRYDNLKTYPFATDDINQIVEILSFMVETRINLDGRYDKNRGLLDNTMVTNTNFGLINKSYTQTNNTFTFLTLDQMSAELDNFANQIIWTKEKVNGEDTDAWTNITLASTADADGTLGNITKITNFNDKLILFQDHGIAQIDYNENTAISTENGLPLELAKTGKFTGFNYLSKEVGCQNKWSISQSKNGLFWIDDSRQELMTFGENIQSLSTINGFDAFMINQLPKTFKSWNPKDFDNFITYYDKLSNDVYYINKNNCLAWNEQFKTFTSFYNYESVPYMVNVGQHSLMWNNGVWAAREADTYSTFFDNTKDYWMTIVCDGMTDKGSAFPADKVFNNIEYRADVFNINDNISDNPHTNYNNSIFNIKHVWNGYQDSEECNLDGIRKFNTWRVQLPRHHGTRDRIRNPFCYIKLKQDNTSLGRPNTQNDRAILHDLAVYFDMK